MGKSQSKKTNPLAVWLLPWLIIVLLSTLVARAVQSNGVLFLLDAKLYDSGVVARPPRAPERITIVGFSEKFMLNRHVSQTPRDRLAQLIDTLVAAHPSVIAIDVWLDSRVEDGARRGDEKLRLALRKAKTAGVPVFLAQMSSEKREDVLGENGVPIFLTQRPSEKSEEVLRESGRKGTTAHGATLPFFVEAASGVGGIDLQPDADRVVRLLPVENRDLYSLPLLAVKTALRRDNRFDLSHSWVVWNKAHWDLLRQGTAPIAYCAPPFPAEGAIPIHDAATLLEQPFLAPMLVEKKIVFIGATYPRSDDLFQTPYNTAGQYRRFYGVEILAHSAATFLNKVRLRSHEALWVQGKILLLAVFIAAIVAAAALFGLLPGVLLMIFAIGGALYVALISSRYAGPSWTHFYPPSPLIAAALMAWALGAGFRQKRVSQELKLVQEAFGGYVGDEVLKQMGGRLPEMGGEVRPIAVLFCDIRGFSALAEKLRDDPARLLGLLNAHFEPLVEALKARGAYVDNYVGDLVMAVFGAPISAGSLEEDTRQAVRAARDIEHLVRERNANLAAGEDPIDVGIGVHCGPAVVGNLGTLSKMHYTAIGDTVNIASRIESETRHYPTHLLVTDDVVQCCGDDFVWEFMAETAVKGRAAPVKLYKPSEL